jgi:molybdopterin/thiamine biosynthesis adenylyltransferase
MTPRIDSDRLAQGRFHRHGLIGWWDQDRLLSSKALVLGVGALGNEVVKNLCMLGVGHLLVVDLDTVENSNLSRSPLFRERDEGKAKAEVAAAAARELFPSVRASWMRCDLVHELGWGHYLEADIVIAGLDGREARLDANRACIRTKRAFFDGAIEGIDGVARSFDGSRGPCYECTMGERDWQLVRNRRSCNMLTREEMRTGHVPTVATVASIVGALQVQQAVKHLHGLPVDHGSGLHVNGLSFEAWRVSYARNEECYAHEPANAIEPMPWSAGATTAREVLHEASRRLARPAVLELRHDILVRRDCPSCGLSEEPDPPVTVGRAHSGAALCSRCGAEARLQTQHGIGGDSPLASRTLAQLGVPAYDIVRLRAGAEYLDFVLGADRSGWAGDGNLRKAGA